MAEARDHQLAPAKLTVSLRVTGVRADGLHLLDAEMVSLDLADELWFASGDSLEVVGVEAGAVPVGDDNLVRRALRAVDRTAAVRLLKRIPAGGGLGGGSADAAAVLRWAAGRPGPACSALGGVGPASGPGGVAAPGVGGVAAPGVGGVAAPGVGGVAAPGVGGVAAPGVGPTPAADLALAVRLGSDVPFCVVGGRAWVRGVGELIEPLPVQARVFTLLLPPFGVSTARVYAAWDELGGPSSVGPNDLEPAALVVEPRLAAWRDALGEATGLQPVLAGSGSTWFVEGEGLLATRQQLTVVGESGRLVEVCTEPPV